MRINEITRRVIGAAYRVHARLGPGLLESAYGRCMAIELPRYDLRFRKEHPLPLIYGGRNAGCAYVADFLVERAVIVEVKSVRRLEPVFTAQNDHLPQAVRVRGGVAAELQRLGHAVRHQAGCEGLSGLLKAAPGGVSRTRLSGGITVLGGRRD